MYGEIDSAALQRVRARVSDIMRSDIESAVFFACTSSI